MNLIGKKVILRAVEESDIELLRNTINDPNIEATIIGWELPLSKKTQLDWFNNHKNTNTKIRYIIADKEDRKALGTIGLYNIDWKNGVVGGTGIRIFNTQNRKKGIAFDAYMTLLKYAFFELRLNRVEYNTLIFNNPARNLMKKLGYVEEGTKRAALYKNGKYNDVVFGACLKSDYEKNLNLIHYWDENFSDILNPPLKNKCTYCMHIQEGDVSIKFLEHIIKTCDCAFKIPILNRVNSKDFFNKLSENAIIIYASQIDILAYVAFYANDKKSKQAYISVIAVKPEMQSNGIGANLINESICVARCHGMNKILLKVDKDNVRGINFYLKHGFKFKEAENNKYIMEKDISR